MLVKLIKYNSFDESIETKPYTFLKKNRYWTFPRLAILFLVAKNQFLILNYDCKNKNSFDDVAHAKTLSLSLESVGVWAIRTSIWRTLYY